MILEKYEFHKIKVEILGFVVGQNKVFINLNKI